jgi:NAD(P)-dependent dehydrogenase (short-subunit alcohol dehydrogenase family)
MIPPGAHKTARDDRGQPVELEGRVAVVTGAASGIGRALGVALAREGMSVVLADVEVEALQVSAEMAREVAVGGEIADLAVDVADAASVEALADAAYGRFGAVHLLCNNAGVFQGGLLWERSLADWQWVLGVNTWGIIHGIRAFVPRMLAAGTPGHVVNTASMAGLVTMPYSGPYVTSKFAAVALSECLAQDLRAVGAPIGVSVVCPSLVATGIAGSARNRPAGLPGARTDSEALVEAALAESTATGLDPAEVAQIVVGAVRDGVFLVPTKPSFADQLRSRYDALLERRMPEMPEID